jgi:thiopurine S-methyltransferase
MSQTDQESWQQCWRDHVIPFHQSSINQNLIRFWPQLALQPSDSIFVPMCGKSLDLMWLYRQGHHVSGVELSPIAVRAFFKESKLQPYRTQGDHFMSWEHDRLRIYCGDFFDLTAADLVGVKALYDQAALTALPEDVRILYVEHLHKILPVNCVLLLMTLEDLEVGETDVVASRISPEITRLYEENYRVSMPLAECFFEQPISHGASLLPSSSISSDSEPRQRCVRKVYILTPIDPSENAA